MNPFHPHNINLVTQQVREDSSLRRMGIQIETEEDDILQEDYDLYRTVLGKVKDLRDFTQTQISNWVTNHWTSHDEIQVRKVGKLF